MAHENSNVDPVAVQKRYPYVIDFEDDDLATLLACTIFEVEEDVSAAQFGDLRERAIVALTAHQMLQHARAQRGNSGSAKMIQGYSAGDVSATYVTAPPEGLSPATMQFYTTQPGVDYMELSQRVGTGVRIV